MGSKLVRADVAFWRAIASSCAIHAQQLELLAAEMEAETPPEPPPDPPPDPSLLPAIESFAATPIEGGYRLSWRVTSPTLPCEVRLFGGAFAVEGHVMPALEMGWDVQVVTATTYRLVATNEAGETDASVVIDPSAPQQLSVSLPPVIHGVAGQPVTIPLDISGGVPPYTLTLDLGDGTVIAGEAAPEGWRKM